MRLIVLVGMLLSATCVGAGCGGGHRTSSDAGSRPDSGSRDAGMDSGRDAGSDAGDAGTQTTPRATGIDPTAGSGQLDTAAHSLRLNVSSPLPVGSTSSTNYTVTFGPRAPR